MTDDEKLMSEALEALLTCTWSKQTDAAIAALRERLAQPEPEPVAWIDEEKKIIYWHNTHATDDYHGLKRTTSLYTDPQPRQLQGLTIAQIDRAANNIITDDPVQWWRQFARAIEAAHGIKE